MTHPFEINKLRAWFLAEKRDLPWRNTRDPYAIWVSEIMLQQTQVSVVLPYFERWLEQFPTVTHLAKASLDDVIKCWEGLGYYSRARNLHAGAKYVLEHFQGKLPDTAEELSQIKGLGPYTVGALLSFAFHQKKAAVDGNVIRVLARYYQIEEDVGKLTTQKKLRILAEELLPEHEPWVISEGLIELGATICQRKARCMVCPLKFGCQSFKNGMTAELPIKSKKAKIEYLYRAVAILKWENHILVKRGKKGEIMSDLYEFPFFEVSETGISLQEFKGKLLESYQLKVSSPVALKTENHGFTRFQVRLDPVAFNCTEHMVVPGMEWIPYQDLAKKAFSSGHRRILQQI